MSFTPEEIRLRMERYKCDPVEILCKNAKARSASHRDKNQACDILLKYCTRDAGAQHNEAPTVLHKTRPVGDQKTDD